MNPLHTNELIRERSPYLLQHAHNPVNWYPWGEKALQKAGQESRMMIISIGYAACHWCHVMEHESFEDPGVAEIMNGHFVAVKVDREERPDVDQVYMNAVQLITGQGGWPLNAFALPDGKPFFAGTYFRKGDWIRILQYFIRMYREQPETLREQAEQVAGGIRSLGHVPRKETGTAFSMQRLEPAFRSLVSAVDPDKGGLNRAPKFPMPAVWEFLLHHHHLSGDPRAMEAVVRTLDNMAMGGIYDQIGGGFARYSTDEDWHVPHFEKMLYDNAQCVSLYAHAWQLTRDPLYREVVYESLDFIGREMTSEEGGFFSSLDADSDGEEGKFYIWTKEELENSLGEDAAFFMDFYHVTGNGNWEDGKNILFRSQRVAEAAAGYGITAGALQDKILSWKSVLLNVRESRVRPALDDKLITCWNALMLKGYVDAYRAFDEERFLEAALRNAGFLKKYAVREDGTLIRNPTNSRSPVHGFLDDYAFTISAFIALYQATFDEQWLLTAGRLTDYVLEFFPARGSGLFYFSSEKHPPLIARNTEIQDNVIPGSNSEMAKNLLALGSYFYKSEYTERAETMLRQVLEDAHLNLYYHANWGLLELHHIRRPFEVAILGPECGRARRELDANFLPDVLLSGGPGEGSLPLHKNKGAAGQTMLYVCRDRVCKLPVTGVSEALEQLSHR